MFLVILLEGYDLIVYGTALPILTEEWGIHSAEAGMIVSSGLFGMVFGASGDYCSCRVDDGSSQTCLQRKQSGS